MLECIIIVSIILAVIFIGTWVAEQWDEDNAHSQWANSGSSILYKEYEKIKLSRRFSGYAGLALCVIALVCYCIKCYL